MRSRHLGLEECYTPYLLFMLFGKTRIALLRTCLDAVPTVDAQLSSESKMSKEASKDNTTLDAVTSRMLILPNPESTRHNSRERIQNYLIQRMEERQHCLVFEGQLNFWDVVSPPMFSTQFLGSPALGFQHNQPTATGWMTFTSLCKR